MTTAQLDKVDRARARLQGYSRIEKKPLALALTLRSLSDVLGVLDDQMGVMAGLLRDVETYRAGKGIRAKYASLRDENSGLRAQVNDLEEYAAVMFKEMSEASSKAAVLGRLRGPEPHIMGGDTVMNRTTGELLVVCGVSAHGGHRMIICGFPFPTEADTADYDLIDCREGGQPEAYKDALRRHGLESFVEVET